MRCLPVIVAMFAIATPCCLQGEVLIAAVNGEDGSSSLIRFDSSNPQEILEQVPIPFDGLDGMDHRPSTGELFGIRIDESLPPGFPHELYLYRVDTVTGELDQVAYLAYEHLELFSDDIGVDFNPVDSQLRIINRGSGSFLLDVDALELEELPDLEPETTAFALAISDGETSAVSSRFGIDSESDRFFRVGGVEADPGGDGGIVSDVGPLGVDLSRVRQVSFDISPSGAAFATGAIAPQELGSPRGVASHLFVVDLRTGLLTDLGPIGAESNFEVKALSVEHGGSPPGPPAIPSLGSWALGLLAGALAVIAVSRIQRRWVPCEVPPDS